MSNEEKDSIMNKESLVYETSDIALAAYLKLRGLVLLKCSRDKKFSFVFKDPEQRASNLAIEFVNSDMRRYDDEIRSLKKIIFNN